MSERRRFWYFVTALALLLAPFALAVQPTAAADFTYTVNSTADTGGACPTPATCTPRV